jgi:uncharacterized membrane protein YccC
VTRVVAWIRARDPGLAALRRAARGAVVVPTMFAVGDKVIGNPTVALFAGFGSFALILLVEFSGEVLDRARSQLALIAAGGVLVCLGSLASRSTWLATVAMAVVGFCVLFAGVVSSVVAAATVSMLLSFILAVSIRVPASAIPDRLAGWALAGAASLPAILLLWPAPVSDRLRGAAAAACRAHGRRLRAEAEYLVAATDDLRAARDTAVEASDAAAKTLSTAFLATPYRPAGLGSATRAVVRLVDELRWLQALRSTVPRHPHTIPSDSPVLAVKLAAAGVLERAADLLERPKSRAPLDESELRAALGRVEQDGVVARGPDLVSALDPAFRAQELAFAVFQIAADTQAAAAAECRTWRQRLMGRAPALPGTVAIARNRVLSHFEPHSVWLHNSVRGAVGLAVAVLVASLTGVQHSFWVILGTLSVLRSNALNTGQSVVNGLIGTAVGVVIGAGVLEVIGTNETFLWFVLPVAVLGAGFAPAAFSFAAGQAAFTVVIVILFNIIQPVGWHVGLLRIEDVAIGFGVSLVVGLLFWPRGAITALRRELAEAYASTALYLRAAVEYGLAHAAGPEVEAQRAMAASLRLDDAFRTYLAERAAKPVPLPALTGLVNGVLALRVTGDAVVDLWQRDGPLAGGDEDVRAELRGIELGVVGWYEIFAAALGGVGRIPDPLGEDATGLDRLAGVVSAGLADADGARMETARRILWTGDHLDAARRLQAAIAQPAAAVTTG